VLFAPAVNALAEFGVDLWLELSAHPALVHSIQECLTARGTKMPVSPRPVANASTSRSRDRDGSPSCRRAAGFHGHHARRAGSSPSPPTPGTRVAGGMKASDWREGRLAPGGRGLLDVRMSRATPTWTAASIPGIWRSSRITQVDHHIIFPAAGFVELVLEAGVQLFEGRGRSSWRISRFASRSFFPSRCPCAHRDLLRASRAHFRHPDPARPWRRVVHSMS